MANKKTAKKKAPPSIHAQRMAAIRPYVNFNINTDYVLSTAEKNKIKRYYDEFKSLTSRPFHPYKTTDKNKKAKAEKFAGQNPRLTGFKTVFVPAPTNEKIKIKFKKNGTMQVVSKYTVSEYIELDKKRLAKDPAKYVRGVIDSRPETHFTIQAGKGEIAHPFSKSTIHQKVSEKVNKYNNPNSDHYFGNWLWGIRTHTFKNQATVREYVKEKNAAVRVTKKQTKKTRIKRKKK